MGVRGGYTFYMRTALQLTVVVAGVVLSSRAPSPVCTPVPVPLDRSSDDVFFIGAPLPDTILAGAGDEKWTTGPGHSSFGRARKIYGQLVQIEQLRGMSRDRLPAETKTVVLVPWDYGADCSTVVWGKSARWVAPDTHVVFRARLRARDQWANGMPTLDVHLPQYSLYPFDQRRLYMLNDTALNDLTIEQVLDLYERLPFDSLLMAFPDSAIRPLEAWARDNPSLATRQPARTILEFVRFDVEERRISMIKSPIIGTYRFVFRVPPGDSLVMYARTEERTWSTERGRFEFGTPEDSAWQDVPTGYTLRTAWAESARRLPRDGRKYSSLLFVSLLPILETKDSTVWRGNEEALDRELNPDFWNRVIYPRYYPQIRRMRNKDWYNMPGFWTVYRNGTVRYRHDVERNGVTIFSIVGERISSETMTRPKEEN